MSQESVDEDEFLDEEKVVEIILELGNAILQNLGVEDKIDDVEVFLSDQFYIHFFEAVYPQINFQQLKGAESPEEVADNIQTLIDLLGQKILNVDLEHIKGEEIVQGNPQHCINLLQLIYQLSMGIQDEDGNEVQNDDNSKSKSKQKIQEKQQEDDEAQIIHEKQQHEKKQQKNQSSEKQKSEKKGRARSFSEDKMHHDQIELSGGQDFLGDNDEDEDEEEINEEDLQMYQQYIQQQQKQNEEDDQQNPIYGDEEDDDDEINLDDIDPEIIEAAKEMGLNKGQIIQLQKQLEQEGYLEEEDGEEEELTKEEIESRMKLLKQKSPSAPYLLFSYKDEPPLFDQDNESDQQLDSDRANSTTMFQILRNQIGDEELQQMALMQNASQDDEDEPIQAKKQEVKKGNSKITEVSKSKESSSANQKNVKNQSHEQAQQKMIMQQQQFIDQYYDEDEFDDNDSQMIQHQQDRQDEDDEMEIDMSEKLKQLQNQQNLQQDEDDDDDYGNEEEQQMFFQQQLAMQQQQMNERSSQKKQPQFNDGSSQKQQQSASSGNSKQNSSNKKGKKFQQPPPGPTQEEDQEYQQEDDEEDEDGKELIDLNDLDENERKQLIEYLHQEYQKNPDQFPFPNEVIQQLLMQHNEMELEDGNEVNESVKDIKSEEMVIEEANQMQDQFQMQQVDGDEEEDDQQYMQEDEDGDAQQQLEDLTPEQQMQLQQYLMMQQQQEQDQFQQKQKKQSKKKKRSQSKKKTKAVNQGIDRENVDPNLLQQMVMAQSQAEQLQYQQSLSSKRQMKGSRKSSKAKKKKVPTINPYVSKIPKSLVSVTPNNNIHFRSFNTNRSQQQQTKKKSQKKKSSKKKKIRQNQEILLQQQNMLQQQNEPEENIDQNINENNQYENMVQQTDQDEGGEQQQVFMEMPVLNEEFLNQLSEEQLQALLEHQQQLMLMQQQQQQQQVIQKPKPKRLGSARPKKTMKQAAKVRAQIYGSGPVNSLYSAFGQQLGKKRVGGGKYSANSAKKVKKPKKQQPINNINIGQNQQAVMQNNFFPALVGGQHMGVDPTQLTTDEDISNRFQKLPQENQYNMNGPQFQQDQIDEVPPEDELESQENISNYQQQMKNKRIEGQFQAQDQDEQMLQDPQMQQQMMLQQQLLMQQQQQQQQQQLESQDDDEEVELNEEQLGQLLANAHNLPPEQQEQLQMILKEKMKEGMQNQRAQNYDNIYSILIDNVQKAQQKLAHLGENNSKKEIDGETDQRILRQKQEFDALLRLYFQETKAREQKKAKDQQVMERQMQRESKMQTIKEKKFEEELLNQQKSLMYKRNAQQMRLCQKVYKLASELEKNKLLLEKKEFKENQEKKKKEKKRTVDAIENYYKDRIQMLKDRIENERFERRIASQAQSTALSKMKRELNNAKKKEVDRYLQLLKQEDQKYDFESTNIQKIENEILKLYKK